MVQFVSMRYNYLPSLLDLVTWVLVILLRLLLWHFYLHMRVHAYVLVDTIHDAVDFCLTTHLDHIARVFQDAARRHDGYIQSVLTSVFVSLPFQACSTIRRAIDFQTSGWLTVFTLVCHQFDLSPQQFCDALTL